MATYRGQDGLLSLGGVLVGSPIINGALAENDLIMDIDAGSLTGIVAAGDTFTLAGESGSPTHTVDTATTFYVASGNAIANITFTTGIAAGGVSDGAAVTFASNSIAQIRSFGLDVELQVLDVTVKGDDHQRVKGGRGKYTAQIVALLDYGDAQQASLIDEIAAGTPDGAIAALVLGITGNASSPGSKNFYGGGVLSNFTIDDPDAEIVTASFDFEGDGAILPDWN